ASVRRGDDAEEIGRLEARAPDESAVHIIQAENLGGVTRLHRSTIENADRLSLFTEALDQTRTYMGMGGNDVILRRGEPGADGPDRLIGDHEVLGGGRLRNRTSEL